MALIECPECGKQISDKAKACIHCGCPIDDLSPGGTVKIKLSPVKTFLSGKQRVTILAWGYKTLWEGEVGEVAEIYFDGPTDITVQYHLSAMHFGGECTGVIDPAKSKKYNVSSRVGAFSTKLVLQPVDVIDAD